jgi:hypothetical protein
MPYSHTANEQVGHSGATLTKGRDPSNTHELQKALLRALQRRLREVRGAIRRTVGYENDALQLRANADATEAYDFPTRQARVRAFLRDLRRWLREALVGDVTATTKIQNGDVWFAEYIDSAYQIGVQNGEGRLLQAGVSLTPSDPTDALRRPIARDQLAELYGRVFENLQGVSEDAARQLRQALTGGLAAGKNPRDIARLLSEELRQIERSRLTTIARTEIVRSHSQAAISTYEQHGADVVSHTSRLTAKDASVCSYCRALGGVPFTLSEFQTATVSWGGQPYRVGIPSHPNDRCSPVPEVGLSAGELDPLRERIPDSAGGKPITLLSA